MVLKFGYLENWIRSTWIFLKCGAEGLWRSVGQIIWEMKKYYTVKQERNFLQIRKIRKAYWIGYIWH